MLTEGTWSESLDCFGFRATFFQLCSVAECTPGTAVAVPAGVPFLWHGTISEDDALWLLPDESYELLGTHRSLTSLRNLTVLPFDGEEKSPAFCLLHQLLNNRLEPLTAFLFPFVHVTLSHPCFSISHTKKAPATHSRSSTHHTVLSFTLFSSFGSVEHFAIEYSNANRRTCTPSKVRSSNTSA